MQSPQELRISLCSELRIYTQPEEVLIGTDRYHDYSAPIFMLIVPKQEDRSHDSIQTAWDACHGYGFLKHEGCGYMTEEGVNPKKLGHFDIKLSNTSSQYGMSPVEYFFMYVLDSVILCFMMLMTLMRRFRSGLASH